MFEHDDLHGHRPNHRRGEESRPEHRRSRDEEQKAAERFHDAGEVPEPLGEADGGEDVNSIRRWVAGELLESRPGEHEGDGDTQRQPGGRNRVGLIAFRRVGRSHLVNFRPNADRP